MQLYSHGDFEGCVQILELVKEEAELSDDLNNKLNNAYLKLAKKYGKSRDYKKALSYLGKVDPKSKLRKKSDSLKKKVQAIHKISKTLIALEQVV